MQIYLFKKVNFFSPWLVGLVASSLLGIGATTYFINRQATTQIDINVSTVLVEVKTLIQQIQASGTVRPIQTVNVSPKTSGHLLKIYVEQGDYVKQGDIIALMENREIKAQILKAKANLANSQARLAELQAGSRSEEIAQSRSRLERAKARLLQLQLGNRPEEISQVQAQIKAAQAKLNLANKRIDRYQYLKQEGAISQDKFDEIFMEKRTAEANLQEIQRNLDKLNKGSRPEEITVAQTEVIEAQQKLRELQNGTRPEVIAQAQATVNESQAQLQIVQAQAEEIIIKAPFSGLISQRYADPGTFVTPTTSSSNDSVTSTSIVALTKGLKILAEIPEADVAQIKINQEVEIMSNTYPGKVFTGKVRLISPEAVRNQNVTLFQVRVDLETGQDQLKSGMNVALTFIGQEIKNAVVVPSVAVLTKNSQEGVLISDHKNKPKFQPVTIGSVIGNQTQIINGVKVGERVFIDDVSKN